MAQSLYILDDDKWNYFRVHATAGLIAGDLDRAGQPIWRCDPMIERIAITHSLELVTGNTSHYQRLHPLGYTPWHSAITTAPWAAGAFIGSAASGMTMGRLGRRVLHAGLVVEAAGLLALAGVLRAAGAGVSTADLLGPMIVGGGGDRGLAKGSSSAPSMSSSSSRSSLRSDSAA